MMGEVKYSLVGSEVVFTKEKDAYNSLRKKFVEISKTTKQKAEMVYSTEIKSIDDLRYNCMIIMNRVFQDCLKAGAIELISYGIYDMDEDVLFAVYKNEYGAAYQAVIDSIVQEFLTLDQELAKNKAARQEMVASATDTFETTGYYDLTGDVGADLGNVIEAEGETLLMNAAATAGAALLSAGFGALEKKDAEAKREEIFNRPSTKSSIIKAIENDAYLLHKTVARIVNEKVEEVFSYPFDEDLAPIEPEIRNAIRGNFCHDEKNPNLEQKQIIKLLTINPYEARIYSYLVKKNNGITDEVKKLVDYLCIDMDKLADGYLRSIYDATEYTTYEAMIPFEELVKKDMEPFGVTECDYLNDVQIQKEELYIIRRTFNNFVYKTIEDRDAAEIQFNEFFEDEIVEEMDMEELMDKYYETLPDNIYQKNREDFQTIIMVPLEVYIKKLKDSAVIASYIAIADQNRIEYGFEKLTLLDALNTKIKKVRRKEKMAETLNTAKEKTVAVAMAATESAKNMGKNIMGKMAFGKKNQKNGDIPPMYGEPQPMYDVPPMYGEPQPMYDVPPMYGEPQPMYDVPPMYGEPPVAKPPVFSEPPAAKPPVYNEPTEALPPMNNRQDNNIICPQCGEMMRADSKFCTKCGFKF